MKLLFFKGRAETADYYTDQLLKAAKKRQLSTYTIDYNMPSTFQSDEFFDVIHSGDCIAVLFDDVGLAFTDATGKNLWKENQIPVYSFVLTYPTSSTVYLNDPPAELTLILPDQSWSYPLTKRYPKVKGTIFLPGGGTFEPVSESDSVPLPYNKRSIDILLLENCEKTPDDSYPKIDFLKDEGAPFFIDCTKELINSPETHTEDIISQYFETQKETCTAEQLNHLILLHADLITKTAHRFLLQELVRSLDQAGLSVEVYGDNWESPDYIYSDAIHLHPNVSPVTATRLMGQAKITLHFMPGYKQGADIGFFDIMQNGSLCISTTNEYTSRRFKDGVHMVNLNKSNPNQTISDIRYLLTHEQAAASIAQKGTAISARDTWEQRLSRLVDLISK